MRSLFTILSFTILTLAFSLQALAVPAVPDQTKTPGELCDEKDPDYANPRYAEKIAYCNRNVTFEQRAVIYDSYRIPENCRNNYTIDHFVPLSIGGNNSPKNLWPEHKRIKQLRINLENEVHQAVRDGHMKQEEAIEVVVNAKRNPPKSAFGILDPCEKGQQNK